MERVFGGGGTSSDADDGRRTTVDGRRNSRQGLDLLAVTPLSYKPFVMPPFLNRQFIDAGFENWVESKMCEWRCGDRYIRHDCKYVSRDV
jgi:hypothetical protein